MIRVFARPIGMFLALVLLVGVSGLVGPQPKSAEAGMTANVNVVNTPTVTVGNTPTVNAQQSGPWNIGITGTPTVNVASLPPISITPPAITVVKNVDEKGRIPYQESGAIPCSGGLCDFAFPAVPAGKRLVIEHVTANINPNPGVGVNGAFLEGAGGFTVFSTPGVSMATPQLVLVSQSVLAYFEAGQVPFYRVAWSSTTNPGAFQVTVTGYLVDLTL